MVLKLRYLIVLFLFNMIITVGSAEPPRVVATASMIQDMAQKIAGKVLIVECIVPLGSDPHLHDPTPRDVKLVNDADVLFKNGLTFEGWLKKLIENSGTKANVVTVTEGVDVIGSTQYENSSDPHAWMSAANGIIYITNIRDALIAADPENKATYEGNYQTYKRELEALDLYIKDLFQKLPVEKRVLITSHDAFQYFGKAYGIKLESFMGTSTEVEAQTSDMIRLTKVVRKNKVPAVFIESTINPKMLEQFAKDNKIQIGGKLFADSIGELGSPADSYAKMLKYNADTIFEALNAEPSTSEEVVPEDSSSNNYLLFGIFGLLLVGSLIVVFRKLS